MIKFIHCSESVIKTIKPELGSVLISITGTHGRFIQEELCLNGWKTVLFLRFSDIRSPINGFILFDASFACSILDFINEHRPKTVYINCEQGISRSAGVRVALEKIFNNNDTQLDGHNTYVAHVLLTVAQGLR